MHTVNVNTLPSLRQLVPLDSLATCGAMYFDSLNDTVG